MTNSVASYKVCANVHMSALKARNVSNRRCSVSAANAEPAAGYTRDPALQGLNSRLCSALAELRLLDAIPAGSALRAPPTVTYVSRLRR